MRLVTIIIYRVPNGTTQYCNAYKNILESKLQGQLEPNANDACSSYPLILLHNSIILSMSRENCVVHGDISALPHSQISK